MENLAETIRNVPLFSNLSREDLTRIVPKFEERRGTRRENGLYLRAWRLDPIVGCRPCGHKFARLLDLAIQRAGRLKSGYFSVTKSKHL